MHLRAAIDSLPRTLRLPRVGQTRRGSSRARRRGGSTACRSSILAAGGDARDGQASARRGCWWWERYQGKETPVDLAELIVSALAESAAACRAKQARAEVMRARLELASAAASTPLD